MQEVLNRDWDPIGVADIVADEYDMYVGQIHSLLAKSASENEIAEYLLWVEVERMGLTGTPINQRLSVAKALRELQLPSLGGSTPDYELPPLGAEEILVRVKASSVNPVDWKIRQGAMKFMTGRKFPRGMGQDFSGVIERIGLGVKRFKVGDEVFGSTPVKTSGSFAETLITQEKLVTKRPPTLSHEEAATLPVAGSTALIALTPESAPEIRAEDFHQRRAWCCRPGRDPDRQNAGCVRDRPCGNPFHERRQGARHGVGSRLHASNSQEPRGNIRCRL